MKQKFVILFVAIAALSSCKKDTTTNTYTGNKVKSLKTTDNKYKSVTLQNFEYNSSGFLSKITRLGKSDSNSTLPYDTGEVITFKYQNDLPSTYTIRRISSTSGQFDTYQRIFKFDSQNRIILDSLISAVAAVGTFSNSDSIDNLSNRRFSYLTNAQVATSYTYYNSTSYTIWSIDSNFIDANNNFTKESHNWFSYFTNPPTTNNNTNFITYTQYINPLYDALNLPFSISKYMPLEKKQYYIDYSINNNSLAAIYNYQYFLNPNNTVAKYIETYNDAYTSTVSQIYYYTFEYY